MSAVTRCISLTALVALCGVAAASEVKGPVHISAAGVTHYNGDTERFRAAMEADARGETEPARDNHRAAADIGLPPIPRLARKLRPRSRVAWAAWAVAASDALAMASASPGAPASSTCRGR